MSLRGWKKKMLMGKQAVMQKVGKAQKCEESEEFQTGVNDMRAVKKNVEGTLAHIEGLLARQTDTLKVSHGLIADYESWAEYFEGDFGDSLLKFAETQKAIEEIREKFIADVNEKVTVPMKGFKSGEIADARSLKDEYNKIRLAHDSAKIAHDSLVAKGGDPQKQVTAEREFAEIKDEYDAAQKQLLDKSNALILRNRVETLHELIILYDELTNFHGQAYAVLCELGPFLRQKESEVLAAAHVLPPKDGAAAPPPAYTPAEPEYPQEVSQEGQFEGGE